MVVGNLAVPQYVSDMLSFNAQLILELHEARTFIELAFKAHPNLDLDVERVKESC